MTLSRLFAVNPVEGERLAARFRDWWDGLGDEVEVGYSSETQQGLAAMGYTPIDMRNLASSGVTEEEAVELIRVWHEGWYEEDTKTYLTPALDLVYYANDVTALYTNVLSSDSLYGYSDISYVYGNEQLSSEYRGDIRTNLYDGRGSVVQNLTDSSVSKTYTYDPYGALLSEVEDLYKPFYGYNGEEYNPLTKLQYLRARYYSPNEGRFTSADTYLGRMDNILSQHRYTYTHNNPINYKDPSGHITTKSRIVTDDYNTATLYSKTASKPAYYEVTSGAQTGLVKVVEPGGKTTTLQAAGTQGQSTATQLVNDYLAAKEKVESMSNEISINGEDYTIFTDENGRKTVVPGHFTNPLEAIEAYNRQKCWEDDVRRVLIEGDSTQCGEQTGDVGFVKRLY